MIALAAGAFISPRAIPVARVQSWPTRFVRVIVPLAPGGPTDLAARLIAEPLSKIWGQQVVIENKPGAGGNLAAELVARSDPDGYTILFATSSLAVNQNLYRTLGYDPIADFAPVVQLTRFPFYMFVPARTPAHIVKKMHADALSTLADPAVRAKLDQNGYGIVGSSPEQLASLLKLEIDKWGTVIKDAGIRID